MDEKSFMTLAPDKGMIYEQPTWPWQVSSRIRGRFVEQEYKLSSSFRSRQAHNCQIYYFDRFFVVQLRSDLDVEQTHLRTWQSKLPRSQTGF
jgi:hypothetical protein